MSTNSTCPFPDNPISASFFVAMGATSAIVFASFGAAYGTYRTAESISVVGVRHPNLILKALVPVIFAGIKAIYGLVIAVIIAQKLTRTCLGYSVFHGFAHFGSGLCVGISNGASGYAIGEVGDCGIKATGRQPRFYVGMILMLIFSEVLGIYGLIIGLILIGK